MKETKKRPSKIEYYILSDGSYLEYCIAIKGLYRYMYFIVPDRISDYEPEREWSTTIHPLYDVSWEEYHHESADSFRKVTKLEVLVICGSVPSAKEVRKAIGTLRG